MVIDLIFHEYKEIYVFEKIKFGIVIYNFLRKILLLYKNFTYIYLYLK